MPLRRSLPPLALVPQPAERVVDDEALALALGAGSAWALAETWRRFAPMVITLGTRALGSASDAEDLAQEVFTRVFRKAHTLREADRLRSFVFSFAVRVLKTELRRRRTRRWLSLRAPEALPEVAAPTLDHEGQDVLRRFYALLERLGTRERLVFSLRHLERLTVEEIAEATELSPSTVKRALARAGEKLGVWVERDLGLASSWLGRMER